jgi:hypothetical protein
MYLLRVYFAGEATPRKIVEIGRAREVLEQLPLILAEHRDCERVDVMAGTARLFSVGCDGQRLPDG